MNVLSAAASAKLARIARFPTFTLTGDGGFISDDITELFTAGSVNWSALLSMTQPLYNFKGLKAREQSTVEAYNEAVANYRQSFLEAVKDVESALVSISAYREQTARYKELVRSNAKIAMMTSALYDNGLTAYLDVIDAQRNLYNSRLQYSNIVAQQYINYINLCKALGGGFKP
jgi:multidrug efflux system outer membrane protein